MPNQFDDEKHLLPKYGQSIEIRPAAAGTGYTSTVLHVSESWHVLVDLPPLGLPVSLRTPRNSRVIARFETREGSSVSWTAIVRAFGNWGVGLLFEHPLPAGEAS